MNLPSSECVSDCSAPSVCFIYQAVCCVIVFWQSADLWAQTVSCLDKPTWNIKNIRLKMQFYFVDYFKPRLFVSWPLNQLDNVDFYCLLLFHLEPELLFMFLSFIYPISSPYLSYFYFFISILHKPHLTLGRLWRLCGCLQAQLLFWLIFVQTGWMKRI